MACKLGLAFGCALLACGWDTPHTEVVIDNAYPSSTANVIYEAFWLDNAFTTPISPGTSSDPLVSVFASSNSAYVLLAPGWDPRSSAAPTSFVVLESEGEYGLDFDNTLSI